MKYLVIIASSASGIGMIPPPQLVGPAIAGVAEQVWMRAGVLHVKVRSAAWRHQLQFQRNDWR